MTQTSVAPTQPGPRDGPGRSGAPSGRLRVLLVEDDDALAELVAEMLAELGCSVSRRATVADALRGFGRGSYDAVISDMVMPGSRNGLDLARELRSRWSDLPVLLITGYSSAASSATEEGFEVLAKPFTIAALAARLGGMSPAEPS